MNVKYKAKKELHIKVPNKVFTLPEGSVVTVTERNGNRQVLVWFDRDTVGWLDASWFINNFEGVPI